MDASACQVVTPVVVVAATGGTDVLDIESVLDIENALDPEGKNSDIYHVINCISHFF